MPSATITSSPRGVDARRMLSWFSSRTLPRSQASPKDRAPFCTELLLIAAPSMDAGHYWGSLSRFLRIPIAPDVSTKNMEHRTMIDVPNVWRNLTAWDVGFETG